MAAQRPRPIAHRVFTVLLAVVLVGSMVGPAIVAQPVAAQEADGQCAYDAIGWWIFDCAEGDGDPSTPVDEVDLHSLAVSEWESMESTIVGGNNYLDDSRTVALIGARDTIASEWENGSSVSAATQAAHEDIRDYYALRQHNYLQSYQKAMAQTNYNFEKILQEDSIDDSFISGATDGSTSNFANYRGGTITPTNNTTTVSVELVNGSTENITVPLVNVKVKAEEGVTGVYSNSKEIPFEPFVNWQYDNSSGQFVSQKTITVPLSDGYDLSQTVVTPQSHLKLNVMSVPTPDGEDDLQSQRVWDMREYHAVWREIESQSERTTFDMPRSAVEDIYAVLDSGEVDPSDVRGPEGQRRYMSGDADAQSGAYTIALYETMGIGSPDLSNVSEMTVSYSGNTSMELVEVGGEPTRSYSDPVNQTYKGILFADEPPNGGFQVNETYNASNLNGSVEMVPFEGDPVSFYDGNFTIERMVSPDGTELQSADWSGPEPESYSSEDFVRYVNHTTEVRETVVQQTSDDDGGSTIGLPGIPSLPNGGGAFVGMAIIGLVVLAVVGFVTDMIPGLGN